MSQPDYEPNVVLSTTEFDVVGTRPIRPDGSAPRVRGTRETRFALCVASSVQPRHR